MGERSAQDPFEAELLAELDSLFRAALRLTRNRERAEDLVQDTVVRAYRYQGSYTPGTNLRAWLLRMLTNLFINQHRRRKHELKAQEPGGALYVDDGVMSRDSMRARQKPESTHEAALLRGELERAIGRLPEPQRTVVVLADIEGLSYQEVAQAIDRPVGTVMSRLHRARAALRAALESSDEDSNTISLSDYRARRVRDTRAGAKGARVVNFKSVLEGDHE